MHKEIVDEIFGLLKQEIENISDDFGKIEIKVMNLMMTFGKAMLQRCVDHDMATLTYR